MNDGVAICIGVLKNVFHHLAKKKGISLVSVTDSELVIQIKPYGEALGDYFGDLSEERKQLFRTGARGNQGRAAHRRQCEQALHQKFADFEPPGFKEDLKLQKAKTNEQAYAIIQSIETQLKKIVLDTLKADFDGENWWYEGIPQKIRTKAAERKEEEKGKGGREDYLEHLGFPKDRFGELANISRRVGAWRWQ